MDPLSGHPVLTPQLAQEIAHDIGRITGFNVLITDPGAVVIGCGDLSRVGTVHEASLEVVRTGRPATHTAGQASRMRGVRHGTSLPITVGEEVIGTVCLTGEPAEVDRFGLVVRRQAEILLEEAALLRSRMLHERAVDDFVRDVALYDPEVVDAGAVDARAVELGLAPGAARAALLLEVRTAGEGAGVSRITVLRTVREVFRDRQDVAGEQAAGRYVVLAAAHGERAAPGRLADACGQLLSLLRERHGLDGRMAVGEPGKGTTGMHHSYRDAATALRIGPAVFPGERVFTACDLRIPHLLGSVPHHGRARFADAVLGDLRGQPDWPTLRETLIGWAEGGFHLVRAAERLHIHRNTLLYRLEKIGNLSGKRVREPVQAIEMYLACLTDVLAENTGPARERREDPTGQRVR
ncbi:sugar diacid recognition domain-containing protein [Streptomyces sp. NPDC005962]|uniref:CdaR family transcriptional regulator n=1 Tax=Streptomyces sp. NPDC005962 TaxID=3154466 RepID=UPI0033CD739D